MNKSNRPAKKQLRLDRQTVRTLDARVLEEVQGGVSLGCLRPSTNANFNSCTGSCEQ